MMLYKAAVRRSAIAAAAARSSTKATAKSRVVRYASTSRPGQQRGAGRIIGLLGVTLVSGAAVYYYPRLAKETPKVKQAEIEFEKTRAGATSKEDNRELISSQHLQVKQSWENPGVYLWGSNAGRVADPDSAESYIKTPRRVRYFDGQILRDIKLDRNFAAAITEKGDLVQWGAAFSQTETTPQVTLKGKNLVQAAISRDRIIALASNGTVYSLPVAARDQGDGEQSAGSSSWIPFWSSPSFASYRTITPANLAWGEKVLEISGGLEHCLMRTSKGRVFSAASSTEAFPSKGQLGIAGLTWATRPDGPFDQPHEITTLRGFHIEKIATGDYHSVVLDDEGRVFSFGDNSTGQLGFEGTAEVSAVDVPSLLPLTKLYKGARARVASISAGGLNTYFTVDATQLTGPGDGPGNLRQVVSEGPRAVSADTWACGEGIYGSLGNGKWTHISTGPTKIKALSGLFEYDESKNQVVPIKLAAMSVGATHACAVMDNVTYLSASNRSSENDTNWGADIVWWGGNEHYQLGTGKRNNVNRPAYIAPLDGGEGDALKGRKGEFHRFHITPRNTVRLGEGGKGRRVSVEQRVECGRFVTAVYSGT